MVGPFEQAAFALRLAQTSDLVSPTSAYHIIRVTDHQPARTMPIDEVRATFSSSSKDRTARRRQGVRGVAQSKGKVEVFI